MLFWKYLLLTNYVSYQKYDVMQSCCSQTPGSNKSNTGLHLSSAYYMLCLAQYIFHILCRFNFFPHNLMKWILLFQRQRNWGTGRFCSLPEEKGNRNRFTVFEVFFPIPSVYFWDCVCCLSYSQRRKSKSEIFVNVRPWALAVIKMTLCTNARTLTQCSPGTWPHRGCTLVTYFLLAKSQLRHRVHLPLEGSNTPWMSLSSESRNEGSGSVISPASNITPRLRQSRARSPGTSPLLPCLCPHPLERMGSSWTPSLHLKLSQQCEWAEWRIRWLNSLYLWTREGAREKGWEQVCIFTSIIPSTSPPTWVWFLAPE